MARAKTRRNHGYTVNPRKDGRWGWAVTTGYNAATGNPERIQGTCKTQREAQEKALAALAKVRSGANVPQGRDQSLATFLESWLELYIRPHREPKTVSYYEGMIKNHLVPSLGRIPLRKLTAQDLQRMLNDKAKPTLVTQMDGTQVQRNLSSETIRGIRATLRSALSRAHKDGMVAENIAQRVVTPRGEAKTAVFLTPDQAATLIKALKSHPLEALVTLTLHSGLRVGEATGLRWDDVDFEASSIRVRVQLQRIAGKLTLKRLKSDRASRTLHLPSLVVAMLQGEKARQVLVGANPANELNLVFLNPDGRPFDPKFVDKHLKAVMVAAGLPPMSFHKLRHTAATLALAHGMPLAAVRDQLGHSQISLTANTYAHAVPTALKEVSETLARLMQPEL